MDVRKLVSEHYGSADLSGAILGALADAGVQVDSLRVEDLAPVDQLHAGFAPATAYLLECLDPQAGTRLLDVGCGIGGPARLATSSYDVQVTGIDLTPEFIDAARDLTGRVGLSEKATFEVASGDALPFADGSFDNAMLIHVGMNIENKQPLFSEIRRVLVPGGTFALYEQMRTGDGELPYPLPWAEDDRSSFLATSEEYAAHLAAAGFAVETTENRTMAVAGRPPTASTGHSISPEVIFGPEFPRRIANNIAATKAGLLGAFVMLARAG
ncbi:MAG: class I SAM-dependent methyltransferase [Actinomycetota bacterium]|nr:class I SAM-dependent methyltransferase [Actinomycetota bacterium]